ncbi:MAG: sugar phosphate isomerase/epimerase family protein [Opitutaceae bacterium]|jgi:sugar phosphate isomerase/epimerase
MKIGICLDPIATLAWPSAPGDFLEANVQGLFIPEAPDTDFAPVAAKLAPLHGRILAANCFLPGNLKVTGPSVDHDRLARYADTAFRRAAATGARFIVFGSGGARQIPDGWSHAEGFEQFVRALEICAPLAKKHGVTLVVEPLNRGECNLINTVVEGAVAVARVNHPNIRLLVDIFHMLRNDESPDDIVKVGPWIAHAHIAEKADRTAPGVAGDDFRPWFAALKRAGYAGALSLECKFGPDPRKEGEASVAFLRALPSA